MSRCEEEVKTMLFDICNLLIIKPINIPHPVVLFETVIIRFTTFVLHLHTACIGKLLS